MTPPIALAHATGFCRGVWDPLIEVLPDRDLTRWDFAGHGGHPEPPEPFSWWRFAEQVLEETSPGMVGVGHSMGGAALAMAEMLDPGRFDRLVLIEPVLFPESDPAIGESMSEKASRRRSTFPSRQAARRHLGARGLFDGWHPAAVDGYLRDGFVECPEGVALGCPPRFEARIYRHYFDPGLWERLAEIVCPVTVVAGAESDTYPRGHAEAVASALGRGKAEVIDGAGHFLPMEKPAVVAQFL